MTGTFRTILVDETEHWSGLPAGCTRAAGLYLFREGEATYTASATPASWCVLLRHVFRGLPADHPFVKEHGPAPAGKGDHYRPFIGYDEIEAKVLLGHVSAPLTIESKLDSMNDAVRRAELWERAEVYFRASGGVLREPSMTRAAALAALGRAARDGDRIVAVGPGGATTLWGGLGNRAGLHDHAYTVTEEKWAKSGPRFQKKLDQLFAPGLRVEVRIFAHLTRDRGRWKTARALEATEGGAWEQRHDWE